MVKHVKTLSALPRVAAAEELLKKDWAVRFSFDGRPDDIPPDRGGSKSVHVSS